MSDVLGLAALCGLFTFMCTTLGASVVFVLFKNHNRALTQVTMGFSAGIMLAASFFSLLLPALENSGMDGQQRIIPVAGGFILGVLFLMILDKSMPHLHVLSKTPEGPRSMLTKQTLLLLAITIHNIPEGMAIGATAVASGGNAALLTTTLILALGIGIQNLPEGAAISMPLYIGGMPRLRAFILGSLSGSVEPLGAVLMVMFSSIIAPYLSWLLAFAAGAMIYVVIEELIPQSHSGDNSDKGTVAVLLGFVLMMVLDVTLG
ncbi:MAG: ZIP family metal transporter [Succinivibrio sp.]